MPTSLERPLMDIETRQVACWRYPPPFDMYNADPDDPELFLTRTASGEGYYPVVDDDGALVAFCVFGAEARVVGQHPVGGTLDIGMGVRPDLTDRGIAGQLIGPLLTLARTAFEPSTLRTAVASFNARSLAVCRKAGFAEVRHFTGPAGRTFRELARPSSPTL